MSPSKSCGPHDHNLNEARQEDIPGPASLSEGDTGAASFYETERGNGSERSLAGVFH